MTVKKQEKRKIFELQKLNLKKKLFSLGVSFLSRGKVHYGAISFFT